MVVLVVIQNLFNIWSTLGYHSFELFFLEEKIGRLRHFDLPCVCWPSIRIFSLGTTIRCCVVFKMICWFFSKLCEAGDKCNEPFCDEIKGKFEEKFPKTHRNRNFVCKITIITLLCSNTRSVFVKVATLAILTLIVPNCETALVCCVGCVTIMWLAPSKMLVVEEFDVFGLDGQLESGDNGSSFTIMLSPVSVS